MANDHYLPQLLLRRFASRVERGGKRSHHKYFVWQYKKNEAAQEKNIREVASESEYYSSNPAADQNLKEIESKFGAVLGELDRGENPNRYSVALQRFTWSLAFRTKALPEKSSAVFRNAIENLISPRHAKVREEWIKKGWREQTKSLSHEQRNHLREIMRFPQFAAANYNQIENSIIRGFSAAIDGTLGPSFLSDELTSARNELLAVAEKLNNPPQVFLDRSWSIQTTTDHSLILGDGGLLACDNYGNFSTIFNSQESTFRILLPISHNSLLVGSRDLFSRTINVDEVNAAAAQTSHKYFYASDGQSFDELRTQINEQNFLSANDINEIALNVFNPK